MYGNTRGKCRGRGGLEAVATRELQEEVGIAVRNLVPFGFGCNPEYQTFTFSNGDKCQFFVLNFWTTPFTGLPQAADPETKAISWFEAHNLRPFLPNMARSIEAYRAYRRDGRFRMI